MAAGPRQLTLPAGLRLVPANRKAAIGSTIGAVLLVCLFIAALDLAFRASLPAPYLDRFTAPLWPRLLWACLGAGGEELVYRLGLMTALAAVPRLWGGRAGPGWMIAAIAVAQLVNVGALAGAAPPWGLLRFWLVGCVWGWLYWRHGFVCALAGHGLAHLLLDPLLLAALSTG